MGRKQRPPSITRYGTITEVRNCGTVVLVIVRTRAGLASPVAFDHRAFRQLLDVEGCRAADLIGRRVTSDGLSMRFVEERRG